MLFCSQVFSASKTLLTTFSRHVIRSYSLTTPQSTILQNPCLNNALSHGNPWWSLNSCRTIMKNRLPRPRYSYVKKTYGWKRRMSYKTGRDIIRRKMLKQKWSIAYA